MQQVIKPNKTFWKVNKKRIMLFLCKWIFSLKLWSFVMERKVSLVVSDFCTPLYLCIIYVSSCLFSLRSWFGWWNCELRRDNINLSLISPGDYLEIRLWWNVAPSYLNINLICNFLQCAIIRIKPNLNRPKFFLSAFR